ncbi:MAG: hypothetical protein H7338_01160 [Candidatus Sericytochromatia bacterium]|nr:hypothetical protein [Candidatus Sericytochromatia bacterium]
MQINPVLTGLAAICLGITVSTAALAFPARDPAMMLAAAKPTAWQAGRPEKVGVPLPVGKTTASFPSNSSQTTLIVRDRGGHGDYFYYAVYLQRGSAYTRILTVSSPLTGVVWDKDRRTVRFLADVVAGYGKMQQIEVIYDLGAKTYRKRILKDLAVEPAG